VVRGIVKLWNEDEGWGVVSSPDVDGDVWAGFATIESEDYRWLNVGATIEFDYIFVPGGQDGYRYRTERIVQIDG